MIMTRNECISRYGPIENGVWKEEPLHCVVVIIPDAIRKKVTNTLTRRPWDRVYCNKDMARALSRALWNVVQRGCLWELHTFDGCFNVRNIRGTKDKQSAHSWALAIDLNASRNPLGKPSTFSPEFVSCFTDEGFVWGGWFARLDCQHFSYAGF